MNTRVIDPTRQGIASHEPEADIRGQAPPVTLEEACAIVDSWAEGYAPFRLHQVARALRDALREARAKNDGLFVENADLRFLLGKTGALLDKADYCSPPLTLEHTLSLMDCWRPDVERWGLHQMCRVLRDEWLRATKDAEGWMTERENVEAERWTDRVWRACRAIPCAEQRVDGQGLDCACPNYPWAPCCNLRVALWAGEPFPTDYLADEGFIHLFEPVDPTRPEAPRKSVGCVKLIEPTACEEWTGAADEAIAALMEERA